MQQVETNLKEQFILELMAFSPKYTILSAEQIANSMSDSELEDLLERLRLINAATAEELSALEQNNPEEYARRMREWEEEEAKASASFYTDLETQMIHATDDVDHEAVRLEHLIDEDADAAEASIEKDFTAAEDMIKSLLEEVEKQEQASASQSQPHTPQESSGE